MSPSRLPKIPSCCTKESFRSYATRLTWTRPPSSSGLPAGNLYLHPAVELPLLLRVFVRIQLLAGLKTAVAHPPRVDPVSPQVVVDEFRPRRRQVDDMGIQVQGVDTVRETTDKTLDFDGQPRVRRHQVQQVLQHFIGRGL